jgi:anti-sigma factor RsiW
MSQDPHSPLHLLGALDGRLTPEERLEVAEHVLGCEKCRRLLHALRWTKVRMAGAGAALPVPGLLEQEVREALRGARGGGATPPDRVVVTTASAHPRSFWQRCLAWWSGPG